MKTQKRRVKGGISTNLDVWDVEARELRRQQRGGRGKNCIGSNGDL